MNGPGGGRKKETQKAEAESPPRRTHTSWGRRKVTLGTKKGINPPKIPQGRPSGGETVILKNNMITAPSKPYISMQPVFRT